jgi:uncharacterized protein YecT (DUF1311 family)
MRVLLFFFSLTCLSFIFPHSSNAQRHEGYCDDVESTAGIQKCIKEHHDTAQERLNSVYNILTNKATNEEDAIDQLSASQLKWIQYRDAHCKAEAALTKSAAVKRSSELSCKTTLTDERIAHLSALTDQIESASDSILETGVNPRWINVLKNSHTDTFWDETSELFEDINCNGKKEHFIIGREFIQLDDKENEALDPEKKLFTPETKIAIITDPETGKPAEDIFNLSDLNDANEDKGALCNNEFEVSPVYMTKTLAGSETGKSSKSEDIKCIKEFEIKPKGCGEAITIRWSESNSFEVVTALDDTASNLPAPAKPEKKPAIAE